MKKSIVVLALTAAMALAAPTFAEEMVPMGEPFQDFTVETTDGETYNLSEALADNKAVVINFYENQCPWCMAEMPYLNELMEQFAGKASFIGLNPDSNDTFEEIATVKEEQGIMFPVARDEGGAISSALPFEGFPCTIVLDASGNLVFFQDYAFVEGNTVLTDVLETVTADDYEGGYELCNKYSFDEEDEEGGEEESASGYDFEVVDQNGDPVPGAVMNLCSDESCMMETADEEGHIHYDVAPGKYHITVLHVPDGYTFEENDDLYTEEDNSEVILINVTKN